MTQQPRTASILELLLSRKYERAEAAASALLADEPGDVGLLRLRALANETWSRQPQAPKGKLELAIRDLETAWAACGEEPAKSEILAQLESCRAELAAPAAAGAFPENKGPTPLFEAACKGDLARVTLLLSQGADIEIGKPERRSNFSPLAAACRQGHLEIANALLDRRARIESRSDVALSGSPRYWTPLMHACSSGHLEVAKLLIHRGANVNSIDEAGWTPLSAAIKTSDSESVLSGGLEIARLLLAHGAIPTRETEKKLQEAQAELADWEAARTARWPSTGMKHFVLAAWDPDHEGGLIESYPPGGPKDWKYDQGVSLLGEYPEGATVSFSSLRPDSRALLDFQPSLLTSFIVSGKVRELLDSLQVPGIEYLPLKIQGHEGEVIAGDYAILNPLGSEHAIDLERSDYRMSSLDKGQIDRIKSLAIDPEKIRPEAKLFRCRRMLRMILVREDVVDAFRRAGLTGFKVYEANGWDGLEL